MNEDIKTNNDFKTICVGDLISSNKYKFIIPSFQRGYRWDNKQVEDLLEDLKRFACSNNQGYIYYLQPLIVSKNGEGNEWYVLDGQQRLTTLKLILLNLKKYGSEVKSGKITENIYEINYQRRAAIDFDNPNQNVDINNYYVYNSNHIIKNWIEKIEEQPNGEDILEKMLNCLITKTPIDQTLNDLKFVKFIWYEIEQNSNLIEQIKVYNRFNSNKIKLTPSELIKALYVLENKNKGNDKITNLLNEWNNIEKQFQNDKFWYLYNDKDIQTRIDYLFDVINDNYNPDEKDYDKSYRNYQSKYDKGNDELSKEWDNVKDYFNNFVKVYDDVTLNNYFGFLIFLKENPKNIFDIINNRYNYDQVCDMLREKIKSKVFRNIDDFNDVKQLTYTGQYDTVKKILLLYNIETCNSLKMRFDFDSFYKEKWEIEHVIPQKTENITAKESQIQWIDMVIEALKLIPNSDAKINSLNEFKEQIDNKNNEEFKEIKVCVDDFFSEKNSEGTSRILGDDEEQSISNLALLDKTTNIAFSNSPFLVKRRYLVKKRIEEGKFVPICTERLFLKYYNCISDNTTMNLDVFHWTKQDRDNYLEDMKNKLNKYVR